MNWFKMVNEYYIAGHYAKEDVAKFVKFRKITAEQYKEITGDEYVAA